MQTSKRGLKTKLGREAWLCQAHCPSQKRGCRATSPAHPAHCAAVTPPNPRWEHGAPSYSLTRPGRGSQTPPGAGGVSRAPAGWANTALTALFATTNPRGSPCAPASGEWAHRCQQASKTTNSSIPGLIRLKIFSPLPWPVKGSCHLNYNICNCANSS